MNIICVTSIPIWKKGGRGNWKDFSFLHEQPQRVPLENFFAIRTRCIFLCKNIGESSLSNRRIVLCYFSYRGRYSTKRLANCWLRISVPFVTMNCWTLFFDFICSSRYTRMMSLEGIHMLYCWGTRAGTAVAEELLILRLHPRFTFKWQYRYYRPTSSPHERKWHLKAHVYP